MSNRPSELARRLAAFWFADIVGFTTMSARDELAALAAVEALRRHSAECIDRVGGRLVKVSGDAVLAEFPSSDAALQSAIQLRDALAEAEPTPLSVHIGVHLGEVSTAGGDIYGDGVNTAARLQSRAEAGQILASEDVYRRVRSNPAFRFSHIGVLRLKGLPEPIPAYAVELAHEGDASATQAAAPEPVAQVASTTNGGTGTRLIVLPFRMLRPDDEIEFLAFSLADAISFSLSKLQALVVRSLSAGARFAGHAADPREVARHADVDLVVAGTLLRVADRVQVTAELNDGRDGTLLGSYRTQSTLGDLFDLQEQLTGKIVQALALPLSTRERQLLSQDAPATARGYELYLRANDLAYKGSDWHTARDLYMASLREDPTYAPAWARLGRCWRLIGKYGKPEIRQSSFAQAEAAFNRATELNPDLDLAHGYAALLETELGRCGDAMVRLLDRLAERPRGVELLAGLVHALRYCGLLDESLAAYRAATAIDPSARVSPAYTYFMQGKFEEVIKTGQESDIYAHVSAYLVLGRPDDAKEYVERLRMWASAGMAPYLRPILLLLDGKLEEAAEEASGLYPDFPDPEGRLHFARQLAYMGRIDQALELIEGIAPVYAAFPEPGLDPWLESLERDERYLEILKGVRSRRDANRARFRAHPASHIIGG